MTRCECGEVIPPGKFGGVEDREGGVRPLCRTCAYHEKRRAAHADTEPPPPPQGVA